MSRALTIQTDDIYQASLFEWLRSDGGLRGLVTRSTGHPDPGQMGALSDVLVNVSTPVAVSALTASLSVWLTQRKSDVKLTVKKDDGREITLDAKRVSDAERLVTKLLEQ